MVESCRVASKPLAVSELRLPSWLHIADKCLLWQAGEITSEKQVRCCCAHRILKYCESYLLDLPLDGVDSAAVFFRRLSWWDVLWPPLPWLSSLPARLHIVEVMWLCCSCLPSIPFFRWSIFSLFFPNSGFLLTLHIKKKNKNRKRLHDTLLLATWRGVTSVACLQFFQEALAVRKCLRTPSQQRSVPRSDLGRAQLYEGQ